MSNEPRTAREILEAKVAKLAAIAPGLANLAKVLDRLGADILTLKCGCLLRCDEPLFHRPAKDVTK